MKSVDEPSMNTICSFTKALLNEENGQDLVEYSLLLCSLALGTLALVTGIGGTIKNVWTHITSTLTSAAS